MQPAPLDRQPLFETPPRASAAPRAGRPGIGSPLRPAPPASLRPPAARTGLRPHRRTPDPAQRPGRRRQAASVRRRRRRPCGSRTASGSGCGGHAHHPARPRAGRSKYPADATFRAAAPSMRAGPLPCASADVSSAPAAVRRKPPSRSSVKRTMVAQRCWCRNPRLQLRGRSSHHNADAASFDGVFQRFDETLTGLLRGL